MGDCNADYSVVVVAFFDLRIGASQVFRACLVRRVVCKDEENNGPCASSIGFCRPVVDVFG